MALLQRKILLKILLLIYTNISCVPLLSISNKLKACALQISKKDLKKLYHRSCRLSRRKKMRACSGGNDSVFRLTPKLNLKTMNFFLNVLLTGAFAFLIFVSCKKNK